MGVENELSILGITIESSKPEIGRAYTYRNLYNWEWRGPERAIFTVVDPNRVDIVSHTAAFAGAQNKLKEEISGVRLPTMIPFAVRRLVWTR